MTAYLYVHAHLYAEVDSAHTRIHNQRYICTHTLTTNNMHAHTNTRHIHMHACMHSQVPWPLRAIQLAECRALIRLE
jgi:hypothetical protein